MQNRKVGAPDAGIAGREFVLMPKVVLVCSEAIRRRMAGIGIRYLRLAEELAAQLGEEFDVVLLSPAPSADGGDVDDDLPAIPGVTQGRIDSAGMSAQLRDAHCVVAQGQLANDVLIQCPQLPVAIDLYDPWLIENLHYFESMGLDPYRNDHATWLLQLSKGDFFLCSSAEQRLFYLGFLTAVGRVNPHSTLDDPELAKRIGIVPFGIDFEETRHTPYLDAPTGSLPGVGKRLLFGGLYDWYDPLTALQALELLLENEDHRNVELLFIRNPNAGNTPQRRLRQVERWMRRNEAAGRHVRFLDWVPYERRFDLLHDVDLLVSTHLPGLETDLSLRTRFLEALSSRCPVIVTEGGALGRHLERADAGWLVPPADPAALCVAFEQVLEGGEVVSARVERGRTLATEFAWSEVVAPLLGFCRNPVKDESVQDFAAALATRAPADATSFRVRRRLSRLFGRSGS